jgi:hypothetical protein
MSKLFGRIQVVEIPSLKIRAAIRFTNLLGINIFKNYMPSVANQTGLDLSKYKVVKKGLFATNLMHVNRDEVLPIALYTDDEPALVSPAYKTFEVIDVCVVLQCREWEFPYHKAYPILNHLLHLNRSMSKLFGRIQVVEIPSLKIRAAIRFHQ